jgi:DNA-nicking Smr family endonuclease
MSKRRRKGLSPEDRAVWEHFVRDAEPLRPGAPEGRAEAPPAEPPAPKPEPARPAPEVSRPGPRTLRPEGRPRPAVSAASLPPAVDTLDPARGLDRRTADRLRRGRRAPEARLDLHGMTADRAHAALARFIRMSRAQGRRCVLVVTGKGGRKPVEDAPFMPERTGVLRHSVPLWLGTPPLSHMIVGVYAAHRSHGGAGALYVYLRKSR